MGDPKGFQKIKRQYAVYRSVDERIKDYSEVVSIRSEEKSKEQASRCMDCGTPFCHSACPIGNYIPEWNDLLYAGQIDKAVELLQSSNNFPEFTGKLCPALCEYACVLGINDEPITVRENELSIIEYAFKKGFVKPAPSKKRTDKNIAIIGSGPAGLACADQLNMVGHNVTVFEKDNKVGGILRYGIPDFKLDKSIIDRRVDILKQEGIEFKTGINVGIDFSIEKLKKEFDVVCLTGGSRTPRDLNIEGRELKGIHFAMDYLIQSNKKVAKEEFKTELIDAKDKVVVIIGGGDTGADCVGTANRQGAKKVVQIELMPKPPESRSDNQPWPKFPLILKTSSSHEEGCDRQWSILTKKFIGNNGRLKKILCVKVEFKKDDKGSAVMNEVPGSEFEINADIVILAMGFVSPEKAGLLQMLGVDLDQRGNVKTNDKYMTSVQNVFAAGDMRRGQSLIVWAISEGRQAAYYIDTHLNGKSLLPLI